MMMIHLAMTALGMAAPAIAPLVQQEKPTLAIADGKVVVTTALGKETFDLAQDPLEEATAPHVAYRKDARWAVWDDRGLTIRDGSKVSSHKLGEIAVSPRSMPRDEIRKSLEMFTTGKRAKESDSLSGSLRIAGKCYFLPRWTQADGKTWLEALVEVDLAAPKLEWKYLGRFAGLTVAYKPVDEKLFLVNGKPAAVVTKGEAWGLATYDTKKSEFTYSPLGANLVSYFRGGFFIEETNYSTYIIGQIDLSTGFRKNLYESRSKLVDLRDGRPVAIAREAKATTVTNLRTGAQKKFDGKPMIGYVQQYVLVWSTGASPKAMLYDPAKWTLVAETD